MAHEVQTEVAKFQWLPLAATPHGRGRRPGEPFAWAVHTEDALAVDDIGVGDTGGFILQLPLRANYAYRLVQAAATVRDADGSTSEWRRPALRMFWHPQPGVNPAFTTEITYPLGVAYVISAENLQSTFFTFGSGTATGSSGNNLTGTANDLPHSIPLIYGYTEGNAIDTEFMMNNVNASQTNYNISYQFRWLAYSIEDSLTTAINWPTPIISV